MKILRFYIKLPPLSGGMEKHIYNLSLNQIKQGNDVTVFFNQGKEVSRNDRKILNRIKLHKIKPQFLAFFFFYLFSLAYLIKNNVAADVIHVHGDWSSLLFIRLLKRRTKAKVVCFSFHGTFDSNRITHNKILPFLLKKLDIVFINGYSAFVDIKKRLKNTDVKLFWRPSGINSAINPLVSKNKNKLFSVISVASLTKNKNIEFILSLAKLSSNIVYYIIGNGPERKTLTNQINKEQISNVFLLGEKAEEELVFLLNTSDLFLLTSFAEGTSTAIIEAMACGLPIISSNVGGIEKLIKNGENGFVINNFIEADYLEKIYLIRNSRELKEKIRTNNLDKSKKYYWDKVSQEISNLFENVLAKNLK